MGKKVIKRDGSKEDFHPHKISKVLTTAGLDSPEAEALANIVNDWVINHASEEISSLEIRDIVLSELRKINPSVANLFAWYQKSKEV